jgi:hypothetical protein
VRFSIDSHFVAELKASASGTASFVIEPASLHLAAGQHGITLTSMLLEEHASFRCG